MADNGHKPVSARFHGPLAPEPAAARKRRLNLNLGILRARKVCLSDDESAGEGGEAAAERRIVSPNILCGTLALTRERSTTRFPQLRPSWAPRDGEHDGRDEGPADEGDGDHGCGGV